MQTVSHTDRVREREWDGYRQQENGVVWNCGNEILSVHLQSTASCRFGQVRLEMCITNCHCFYIRFKLGDRFKSLKTILLQQYCAPNTKFLNFFYWFFVVGTILWNFFFFLFLIHDLIRLHELQQFLADFVCPHLEKREISNEKNVNSTFESWPCFFFIAWTRSRGLSVCIIGSFVSVCVFVV